MKLKFNTHCVDKNTNAVYEVGSVVEFDDERGAEILSTSFASVVEDTVSDDEPVDVLVDVVVEEPIAEPKKKKAKKEE